MSVFRLFLVGLSCAACAPNSSAPTPRQPLPEPVPFTDINPDPDIVEVSLAIREGTVEYVPNQAAHVLGYVDIAADKPKVRVPGPLVAAKQGDLVIVHAQNELPKDGTSIHFHGIRLSSDMDGAHHTKLPGSIWEQSFIAKDAGLFWYHPHTRADVQIERGLHAPLVVYQNDAPKSPADRILVLDDVKLDSNGDLEPEWSLEDILHGRQGNVLLVNGIPDAELRTTRGSRERWRLVNTANGRLFELELEKHALTVIGWDGGLLAKPYVTRTLRIAPGERYDVLVDVAGNIGDSLVLQNLAAHHDGSPEVISTLLTVLVEDGPVMDAAPGILGQIEALPMMMDTPERTFVLEENLEKATGPIYTINKEIWPFNTPIEGSLGALEIWRVQNATKGDHPFHLHGMFFQTIDINGISVEHLGWKDTVLVPAEATLRFTVRYDEPGVWMYHCQIPEHAERGMMGDLLVGIP